MNESDRPATEPDLHSPAVRAALDRYWRDNMRIMAGLLCIWAAASFGCGILIADWLNRFYLPFTGFPLGFWFAQQGSIVVFVLCILAYCVAMNRLDRRHHRDLERINAATTDHAGQTDNGRGGAQ
jgi:putative solute:sodium symporter small subunit